MMTEELTEKQSLFITLKRVLKLSFEDSSRAPDLAEAVSLFSMKLAWIQVKEQLGKEEGEIDEQIVKKDWAKPILEYAFEQAKKEYDAAKSEEGEAD